MEKSKTLAITTSEGGYWVRFSSWASKVKPFGYELVHSIVFEDGSVWDAKNGWREEPIDVEFLKKFLTMEEHRCHNA